MPPKPSIPASGPRSSPPTHFLCIPLVTAASRPQLSASLSAFEEDVCSPTSFALPEEAVRPVGTLHLTLGVMSFPSTPPHASRNQGESAGSVSEEKERSLDKARELLRNLKLREIWRAACREAEERTRMPEAKAGTQREDEEEEEIKIMLKGLASMQTPTRASVLYAPPVDPQGKLYGFCEKVRDAFREGGVMGDDGGRPLLLHATVVNTIYVKDKGNSDAKRGGRGGGGRGRGGKGGGGRKERLAFDATGIIDRYEEEVWMKGVKMEGVAICKMGAKKVLSEDGEETGDEKYEVIEEVAW